MNDVEFVRIPTNEFELGLKQRGLIAVPVNAHKNGSLKIVAMVVTILVGVVAIGGGLWGIGTRIFFDANEGRDLKAQTQQNKEAIVEIKTNMDKRFDRLDTKLDRLLQIKTKKEK